MKILISGGHLMPALAVIDKLFSQKNISKKEIIFVGRQYNLDSEQSYSLEYQEVKQRHITFIPLVTGRLKRQISISSLKNFLLIFIGLKNALTIINQVKPTVILSFGGYLGFPFMFWGWFKKIPVYIHEQTLNPGAANRIGAYLAKKVFISFPQTEQYFPAKKVMVTGNPVRTNIFSVNKKPFKIKEKLPVIYVTGGSLGSHSLNLHLGNILKELLKKFIIIHQTGNVKEYDDYQKLSKLRESLPIKLKNRYFLGNHFYSDEIGFIYSVADFVISRSGANTFFELIALKKPAILVPLPWSANQEQQHQAQLFVSKGLGEIFSQFEDSQKLLKLIKEFYQNLGQYKKNFNQLESLYQQDAAEKIIQTVLS